MPIPFIQEITQAQNILLCGAGGGFDVYSAIPLYYSLKKLGHQIIFGNYSFSTLELMPASSKIGRTGVKITTQSPELHYFPEKYLIEWLNKQGEDTTVIGFRKSGIRPLRATLEQIVEEYTIDTIILVDGGTDSLMTGNESGLGTPTEDITTMVATHQLTHVRKYLACLGFGIDHFHGVCHAQFLENVAHQIKKGGYKGSYSVTNLDEGGQKLRSLIEYANGRGNGFKSIVANSIGSALAGEFGNYHATHRTQGSQLFINPLMCLYWFFDLGSVVEEIQYLSLIEHANTQQEVLQGIRTFRQLIVPKVWEDIPL